MAGTSQIAGLRARRDRNSVRRPSEWNGGVRLEQLGNLAHELRAPLQVLLGYLDILRDEYGSALGDGAREMLEQMNVNAYNLAQTVENVVDFATTIDFVPSRAEKVVLHELVTELKPYFDAANRRKHLDFRIDLSAAPASFRSWRRAVKSILLNLGLNAIKFTDVGSVLLLIRALPSRRKPTALEISVRDTGTGLDRSSIRNAFDPWIQLSSSSARLYRGLGIGLSNVLRNVESLRGSLDIWSEPDHGSMFVVKIPVRPMARLKSCA